MNASTLMALSGGQPFGLAGLCSSEKQTKSLQDKSASVWLQYLEYNTKYKALADGNQAQEWADLKKQLTEVDNLIDEQRNNLEQESLLARELGVNVGLGLFCNKWKDRRKEAEKELEEASISLGKIKGSYDLLVNQQTEGISQASVLLEERMAILEGLKTQLATVKQKIENYKIQRDAESQLLAVNAAQVQADAENALTAESSGSVSNFLTGNNMPLIIGGVVLGGILLYNSKKKKSK